MTEYRAMSKDDLGKYMCVAPERTCGSSREINNDGVWIKGKDHWSSAHRGCAGLPPSKGYSDEPKDLPVGSPYWVPYGAYGYTVVHQRTVGSTGSSDVYGPKTTLKLAQAVSAALNEAYRQGRHDRVHQPEPQTRCHDRDDCPGWG